MLETDASWNSANSVHSAFVGCLQFAWVPVPQFPDVIILKFEGKVEELDELLDELDELDKAQPVLQLTGQHASMSSDHWLIQYELAEPAHV